MIEVILLSAAIGVIAAVPLAILGIVALYRHERAHQRAMRRVMGR